MNAEEIKDEIRKLSRTTKSKSTDGSMTRWRAISFPGSERIGQLRSDRKSNRSAGRPPEKANNVKTDKDLRSAARPAANSGGNESFAGLHRPKRAKEGETPENFAD